MWWPKGTIEMKPEKAYRCEACDVYGKGDVCWMCGSADVEVGKWASAVSGHHHDPAVTVVQASSAGQIPVDSSIERPW